MCCEPRGRHVAFDASDGCCCCCGSGAAHHFRRYVSKRERIERLEAYREELKRELEGVDEAIDEIKGS
jgi:hypothetical protein